MKLQSTKITVMAMDSTLIIGMMMRMTTIVMPVSSLPVCAATLIQAEQGVYELNQFIQQKT